VKIGYYKATNGWCQDYTQYEKDRSESDIWTAYFVVSGLPISPDNDRINQKQEITSRK
jgi:hypothetical protein